MLFFPDSSSCKTGYWGRAKLTTEEHPASGEAPGRMELDLVGLEPRNTDLVSLSSRGWEWDGGGPSVAGVPSIHFWETNF